VASGAETPATASELGPPRRAKVSNELSYKSATAPWMILESYLPLRTRVPIPSTKARPPADLQPVGRAAPAGNAHDPVSSNVDMGSAVPIGLGTADYLARDGGNFSHPEDQEADEVRCRIAFGPFEIDVRETVSAVADSQQ
jgi:hypothetical protein